MMAQLMIRFAPWLLAVLLALAGWQYWVSVTDERDALRAALNHSQEQAEVLREHQRRQRQQIETLNSALAERERTIEAIDKDIGASAAALEPLGERDAEASEWLDSDLPTGIADWMRQLQQPSAGDAVRLPNNGASTPNE